MSILPQIDLEKDVTTRWYPTILSFVLFSFCVALTSGGCLLWAEQSDTSLWLANGAVLAFLLFSHRRQWSFYLVLGFAINLTGALATGHTPLSAGLFSLVNSLEILAAALPLYSRCGRQPALDHNKVFFAFFFFAILLAPFLSALCVAEGLWYGEHLSFIDILPVWYLCHALGIAIATPFFLCLLRGDFVAYVAKEKLVTILGWMVLILATMGGVFYQTHYPLLFLIPPVLLAATVTQGFVSVVLFTTCLTFIALWSTSTGHGPFALALSASLKQRIMLAQLFVLSNFVMMAFVSNTSAERRRIKQSLAEEHRQLIESEARYRLLADNAVDIVSRVDEEGVIHYVSPAIEEVLGWKPEELIGRTTKEYTHPDDVHLRQDAIGRLKMNDGLVRYRVRAVHKNGTIVWLERRTRSVIHEDKTIYVSCSRDITASVEAETLLAEANTTLSELAMRDGLTGIANRRFFDDTMAREWRRAQREGKPLSLLLIDVDHFKAYNDTYGHQSGDSCLVLIAGTVATFAHRPGDLAARYGGEELALILPDCLEVDAKKIAEKICLSIEELQVPHVGNGDGHGRVTVSIGVATFQPSASEISKGQDVLIKLADQMLYEAKRTGRNKAVSPQSFPTDTKPLFPIDEERRLHAVDYYVGKAWQFSDELNKIAYLAATMLNTPLSFVSLVGRDNQVFLGKYGSEAKETSREKSYCAQTLNGSIPLVVHDATQDVRFKDTLLAKSTPDIRFYAGAPLMTPKEGIHLGALCVVDHEPREKFDEDHKKLLTVLAALAMKCMESHVEDLRKSVDH